MIHSSSCHMKGHKVPSPIAVVSKIICSDAYCSPDRLHWDIGNVLRFFISLMILSANWRLLFPLNGLILTIELWLGTDEGYKYNRQNPNIVSAIIFIPYYAFSKDNCFGVELASLTEKNTRQAVLWPGFSPPTPSTNSTTISTSVCSPERKVERRGWVYRKPFRHLGARNTGSLREVKEAQVLIRERP